MAKLATEAAKTKSPDLSEDVDSDTDFDELNNDYGNPELSSGELRPRFVLMREYYCVLGGGAG